MNVGKHPPHRTLKVGNDVGLRFGVKRPSNPERAQDPSDHDGELVPARVRHRTSKWRKTNVGVVRRCLGKRAPIRHPAQGRHLSSCRVAHRDSGETLCRVDGVCRRQLDNTTLGLMTTAEPSRRSTSVRRSTRECFCPQHPACRGRAIGPQVPAHHPRRNLPATSMDELVREVRRLIEHGPPGPASQERQAQIDRARATGRAPAMKWATYFD
jgi:hypothetical protein